MSYMLELNLALPDPFPNAVLKKGSGDILGIWGLISVGIIFNPFSSTAFSKRSN